MQKTVFKAVHKSDGKYICSARTRHPMTVLVECCAEQGIEVEVIEIPYAGSAIEKEDIQKTENAKASRAKARAEAQYRRAMWREINS